ncbi:MAG: D-inositol-3-phosphate glycosyltransferase [Blastocatellia bacterium]|nr:D-inositol-3-phosphate glycosyltransferase [Blastocatellia bacterium]
MAYARSPPIITFVGRPLASRKGLATFIDAIAVLGTLDLLPPYQVWLVGGDTKEQRFLQTIPLGHSMLQELVSHGRWIAWGAVENTFLPEIYSRSTIVVIPSMFEQFGLVALEAMACGCPVVASDVGGIRDTIVPGVTGELFPADDAEALANVLTGYLRNPQRRGYQSANAYLWARGFSTDKVYGAYYKAVCHPTASGSYDSAGVPKTEWHRQVIEGSLPECAKMLNQTISKWEDCSGNSQVGARLTTTNGEQYHAKFLRPRPSTHSLVLPVPLELQGPRTSAELVAKFEYFRGSGLTPTIEASSMATGIVLTEWLPRADEEEMIGTTTYSHIVQRFAEWGGGNPEVAGLISKCTNALKDFAFDQNEKTLTALDHAAAHMHAPMLGGRVQFHRIHPQVELFRVFGLLKGSVWSMSTPVRSRLESVLGLLLREQPVIVEPPRLMHGSLKPTHVLKKNGQTVACDLDNAIYAVGPLDAVHWHVGDLRIEQIDLRETLGLLSQLTSDSTEYLLAASWLFVYLVYGLLDAMMRGKKTVYRALTSSLMCAYEGMFRHRLIRWE